MTALDGVPRSATPSDHIICRDSLKPVSGNCNVIVDVAVESKLTYLRSIPPLPFLNCFRFLCLRSRIIEGCSFPRLIKQKGIGKKKGEVSRLKKEEKNVVTMSVT